MIKVGAQTIQHTGRNRWLIWAAVAVSVLMTTIDSSIVNISLPIIAKSLHSDLPSTQWIVLAYMITAAALLLPAGRLGDRFGRREVYVGGILLFCIGTSLSGLSGSVAMLVASRMVQAVGAASVMANGPAITAATFQENRAMALGLIGTIVSLGSMLGPSLGGWIVDAWGWPWIFWVNLPIGLLSAIYAWRMLSHLGTTGNTTHPFDSWGMTTSASALAAVTVMLTYGLQYAWFHPINISLGVFSLAALAAFILQERRHPSPLLPLSLLKSNPLVTSCFASALSFLGITSIFFIMPFYFQNMRGFSPSFSGLLMMACPLALAVISPVSGKIYDRTLSYWLPVMGMGISAVALTVLSGVDQQTSLTVILISLMGVGLGNGLFNPANNTTLLTAVPEEYYGLSGGLLAVVRTLGMTAAIALCGVVFRSFHLELTDTSPAFLQAFTSFLKISAGFTLVNIVFIVTCKVKKPSKQ